VLAARSAPFRATPKTPAIFAATDPLDSDSQPSRRKFSTARTASTGELAHARIGGVWADMRNEKARIQGLSMAYTGVRLGRSPSPPPDTSGALVLSNGVRARAGPTRLRLRPAAAQRLFGCANRNSRNQSRPAWQPRPGRIVAPWIRRGKQRRGHGQCVAVVVRVLCNSGNSSGRPIRPNPKRTGP
jgi:hypothetical protein